MKPSSANQGKVVIELVKVINVEMSKTSKLREGLVEQAP